MPHAWNRWTHDRSPGGYVRPKFASAMRRLLAGLCSTVIAVTVTAVELPDGFVDELVIDNLDAPATLRFSPHGRMYVGERIQGRLLVASLQLSGDWAIDPLPAYVFDVPTDNGSPARHRSSGVRDLVFSDDGKYAFVFYMRHDPRHNRVIRLNVTESGDAFLAGSEEHLIDLPFNVGDASGSHNGGALGVNNDDQLLVTTGDGWNGGDPVQSLNTFTGKVLRINFDGSIPSDNPFYNDTAEDLRAIFALGLRNPFSMSRRPNTGSLYINDVVGNSKADIFLLTEGANYGHDGVNEDLGTSRSAWVDAGATGGSVISGGAWYPEGGPFPDAMGGGYFVSLWGANNGSAGHIVFVDAAGTVAPFASSVVFDAPSGDNLKPVLVRVGPDGWLYYLLTSYETDYGQVRRIRWDGIITEFVFSNGFEAS